MYRSASSLSYKVSDFMQGLMRENVILVMTNVWMSGTGRPGGYPDVLFDLLNKKQKQRLIKYQYN